MIEFGGNLLYTVLNKYRFPFFIHQEDSMKYLLYFTPDRAGSPSTGDPVADNKAAVAYIAELQKKGMLETAYAFVTGGGIGIVNVASHEELWELLYAYPLYPYFNWRVEPLADVSQVFSKGIAMLEQTAKK